MLLCVLLLHVLLVRSLRGCTQRYGRNETSKALADDGALESTAVRTTKYRLKSTARHAEGSMQLLCLTEGLPQVCVELACGRT